jgi:hypothetical protein
MVSIHLSHLKSCKRRFIISRTNTIITRSTETNTTKTESSNKTTAITTITRALWFSEWNFYNDACYRAIVFMNTGEFEALNNNLIETTCGHTVHP